MWVHVLEMDVEGSNINSAAGWLQERLRKSDYAETGNNYVVAWWGTGRVCYSWVCCICSRIGIAFYEAYYHEGLWEGRVSAQREQLNSMAPTLWWILVKDGCAPSWQPVFHVMGSHVITRGHGKLWGAASKHDNQSIARARSKLFTASCSWHHSASEE